MYYNRFRYYSPDSGTYISQDPIGLDGGGRLYGYVHDPNTWIDPLGLAGEFDIGTYGGLKGGTNVGDNLSAHELLQNAWLQHNDNVKRGVGSKSLDNPAIALGENPIHKRIGDLQRKHNLYDKNTLLKQSALENINKNAALTRRGIYEGLLNRGWEPANAKRYATELTMKLREDAIDFAKKQGYICNG